ncbi:MAG: hypothetical protein H7844_01505 [Nitrospirae bacterium YQR-1]
MKKIFLSVFICFCLLAAISVYSSSELYAGSYVRFYLPYLHTNSNNITYCIAANSGSAFDNITALEFKVTASGSGSSTSLGSPLYTTANNLRTNITNFTSKRSTLVTFSGQGVYVGTSTDALWDISGVTDTTLGQYATALTFVSTLAGSTGESTGDKIASNLDCKKFGLTCFQGTTSPKRNVVGYTCEAGTYDGTTYRVYRNRSYNSVHFEWTKLTQNGQQPSYVLQSTFFMPNNGNVDSGADNATDLTY